ncbi:EAL domain-containing protein [Thalassotalea sp. Y01]|uniref:EAL domain-containing protein n=1 Tax=Thalassotalea sp. Y01 TaxID=2729613 RepID=UPI00145EF73C|nr:EAL domain-containing protein [Thalassotalea sp. Y01]
MRLNRNNKKQNFASILTTGLLVFLLFFSALATSATQSPLKFQQYSTKEGLSENSVYSITQDHNGFIWFATLDGLNKFDGYEFVQYHTKDSNNSALPSDLIRVVFVDSRNRLWVGTQAGLALYNATTDSFEDRFEIFDNQPIWSIFEDNQKNILISTNEGLYKLSATQQHFTKVSLRQFSNDVVEVKTIFQDNNNNYWFGTFENGLYIANESLDFVFSAQENNKLDLEIASFSIYEIELIEDHYWVATGDGIYVVDYSFNIKKHIKADIESDNPSINKVRAIEKANEFEVFLGTEAGLYSYNLVTESISQRRHERVDSTSLDINFVYSLFKDKASSIWAGTYTSGATKHTINSSLFNIEMAEGNSKNNIVDFAELDNQGLYIANQFEGIFYKNYKTQLISPVITSITDGIRSIHRGSSSELLILTNEYRLLNLKIESNEIEEIWQFNLKHLRGHDRFDFEMVDRFVFHGSNDRKIFKFDIDSQQLSSFPIPGVSEKFYILPANHNDKVMIFGSSGEFFEFDIDLDTFEKLNIPKHELFLTDTLAEVKFTNDFIWFSFWGKGILTYDKQKRVFQHYNEVNGLVNDYVFSFLLDNESNAWLSTNKGISKVSPTNKTVFNYDNSYGVQNSQFWVMSSFKGSDGQFYFGNIRGFNSFYAEDITPKKGVISPPINTKLLIANKEYKKLDGLLYALDSITLEYNQSPFTIEFSSPNSSVAEQVLYRYKLMGVDNNWIETDSHYRRATYTNLNDGSYTFLVESYDQNNSKYFKGKQLTVHILPPWWKTNSAWAIYGLIIFFIGYYFYNQTKTKQLTNAKIKQSEERLKLALWGSGDEMWDWNLITNRMYRSNIWGVLNFPKNGKSESKDGEQRRNIHPQDYPRVKQLLLEHRQGKSEHYEAAYRVKDMNSKWMWVLDRGKVVERNDDGEPIRMTGTLKDINQIKANEESLKLFAKCIANISDAVVVYDAQFKAVDCNDSYQLITGQTREQALGKELEFNSYPPTFLQNLKRNLLANGTWQGEIESKRDNGEAYLIDITLDIIRDENDEISHFVAVFSDITKRKQTEEELRKLANSDTLTGLPNRSFFQGSHSQLINQETEHALLVFDLDNFKKINDSLSHQVGDVLLCKVTERIATINGIKDTFYRLGGDEFSLVLKGNNDIHNITSVADEILSTIVEPYSIQNNEISLSCSIGIALYPDDGNNTHELLKNADTAMYHAKDEGGDCYQFFNDSMNKQAVKRLQIENLIRHGLKEDLFSVFYQPKIEVSSGKVVGMEALVRFEAGSKGVIRPDIFIPISEETGQIIEIGEIVLRKACLATKAWMDNGIFSGRIAVNLSAVQFKQPNLVQIINEILEETGLPADRLELEITEGTVMNSPQEAIETMHQIRRMGIHLSLDDFGTGYSSLAYLKQFPINTLKIDKAFVDDIEASEEGRNMVATIVTIAHNLGMEVVAEGVETEKQLDYLKILNCEQMQGYLYSKPLAEPDFGRYLLSHIITNQSTPT